MSNQSVQIQWLDVNSDATILQVSPLKVTKNQAYILQVIVPSLDDSQIRIEWASNPTINSSCIISSGKQYVVDTRCVSENVRYNVTAKIVYLS